MKNLSTTILLIEDNADDVFAMKRALRQAQIANPLQVLSDGQEALDYLSGSGKWQDRDLHPLPFIIFLDLKLPYIDGFEILPWLRQQPALKDVVVVVLTSSAEIKDHERAYALGARSYLVKPPTPDVLNRLLDSLQPYWFGLIGAVPVLRESKGS